MFRSARIQLTLWYLIIIMLVSGIFSIIIYRSIAFELNRFARIQRYRFEHPLDDSGPPRLQIITKQVDPELIEDSKQRVAVSLILINVGILVVSGGVGYFLAGRTLKPIHIMVEEQKRFITDASHEFRTPLTALRSSIEVNLRDSKLSIADARALLKSNLEDVRNLQYLSDHLLQLAQYQEPKSPDFADPVSIDEVVDEAMKQVHAIAAKKHIVITKHGKNETLNADKKSMVELLVILLENAVKYSPEKTAVEVISKKIDGHVAIHVRDEGPGINPKDVPHIFDRFYRADRARSKYSSDGYGLGLAIAKRIVQNHSGSIEVKQRKPTGAEFVITLPITTS